MQLLKYENKCGMKCYKQDKIFPCHTKLKESAANTDDCTIENNTTDTAKVFHV